jgi:hypothetical protein
LPHCHDIPDEVALETGPGGTVVRLPSGAEPAELAGSGERAIRRVGVRLQCREEADWCWIRGHHLSSDGDLRSVRWRADDAVSLDVVQFDQPAHAPTIPDGVARGVHCNGAGSLLMEIRSKRRRFVASSETASRARIA